VKASTLRTGRRAAAVLAEQRHLTEALRARQLVARAAAEAGALALARREAAAAAPLGRRGAVADRVGHWHVEGLLRHARGDARGAERALKRGLELVEGYRAAFGAVELRATASAIGVELAEAGLRIALGAGDAEDVLAWAERLRGNALRLPPLSPAPDLSLRSGQTELRRVAAQMRAAEESGRPVRALAARQRELEAAIRARTRHVRGDGGPGIAAVRRRDAARALGARALVEYVALDGELLAVTLVRGALELHRLGDAAAAARELEWLRFALGRLAQRKLGTHQRAASSAAATAAADALDAQLVGPLLPALGEAPLVIVPTGVLHVLPWSALPSLRGRPVAVSPSLSLWVDLAGRARPRRRRTVLVGGPRLRHAGRELRELAALYPDATVLGGAAATAGSVLRALDGAALAHVACHGRFRADSPLFSALELADGPLTALELQRLRRAPDVLVLSACDLALSARHPGDELLGLSAALLATGTRTLVASVVPVPDAASRRVMVAFHRRLEAASPAAALAGAQAEAGSGWTAAGFVCLGAG
jgi:hypothetical protein